MKQHGTRKESHGRTAGCGHFLCAFRATRSHGFNPMIFQDHPLHTHTSARTLVFFHPDQEPILRKAARSPIPPQAGSLLTVIEAGIEITSHLGPSWASQAQDGGGVVRKPQHGVWDRRGQPPPLDTVSPPPLFPVLQSAAMKPQQGGGVD